ncbi:MAG: hypothetical protein WCC14_07765 [Acidobacteriaceae bacterium]
MNRQTSKVIEKAIKADDWAGARRLIQAELRLNPKDHWLMSRLALTYYEQRKYEKAMYWDVAALQEAPCCPLAMWSYAGTLDMLGRYAEALVIYRCLASWSEEELAHGNCGEGVPRARSLITDCLYRIARIWEEKRQWKRSAAAYKEHLSRRKNGSGSIYPVREVKVRYEDVLRRIRG